MVNVEAIERIDALYGPFSAIYPGNSIGTTLIVTERKPRGLEASASIKLNQQGFNEYATSESYTSKQLSGRIASRLDSRPVVRWSACSTRTARATPWVMPTPCAVPPAAPLPRPRPAAKGHRHRQYDRDPRTASAPCLAPRAWTTTSRTPSTCAWATTCRPRRRSRPAWPGGTTTAP
jgi:hypothetical protein